MIKPHELFPGAVFYPCLEKNGLAIPDQIPFVIYEITFNQVKAYRLGSFPYKLTESEFSYFDFQEISPITLTPEILTDWCGWNEDIHKVYKPIHAKWVNKIMIAFWKVSGSIELTQFGEYITALPNVKYLHQLQYLYFLLTGEAMEINVPKNQ